jgi:PAS domain-containing protein
MANGDDFLNPFHLAAEGSLAPFILVVEGSIPNENNKQEGYWASLGTDKKTGQPITTCEWIDRIAPLWFIHGVGFDITELKQLEEELQQERNVASAILHTVGSLVVVLDPQGRIVRFNRACEKVSGYSFAEVEGKYLWDLCVIPEEANVSN